MANSSRLDSDREQQGERHQNQHSQSHLSEWGPVVRENRAPREGSCSESEAPAYLPSVKWRHTHVSDARLPHAIGFLAVGPSAPRNSGKVLNLGNTLTAFGSDSLTDRVHGISAFTRNSTKVQRGQPLDNEVTNPLPK